MIKLCYYYARLAPSLRQVFIRLLEPASAVELESNLLYNIASFVRLGLRLARVDKM